LLDQLLCLIVTAGTERILGKQYPDARVGRWINSLRLRAMSGLLSAIN
jgi:hypothetical protein